MFVLYPLLLERILIKVAAVDLLMTRSRVTFKKPRMLTVKLLSEVRVWTLLLLILYLPR